ncbi:hypothetical protein Taro_038527 [Colocasia esculenta]|uniref:Uncharacterized protein n=1 Tax=Colocasia esculenta TaxID=4460 RepID=A0A843W6Y1_COLES|nr:hypothetical protein [Colocasia esculenta]
MRFYRVLDPHIPLLFGARSVFLHSQELDVKSSCRQDLQSAVSDLAVHLLERPDTVVKFFSAEQPSISLNGQTLPLSSSVQNSLVQAMQTQAHTQAALQAQLEAQAQVPTQDHGGPSIMERFKRILPPSFKGESDPLLAESWMREIEKIFRAIRCADEDKVTLATYMLQTHPLLRRTGLVGDPTPLEETVESDSERGE